MLECEVIDGGPHRRQLLLDELNAGITVHALATTQHQQLSTPNQRLHLCGDLAELILHLMVVQVPLPCEPDDGRFLRPEVVERRVDLAQGLLG